MSAVLVVGILVLGGIEYLTYETLTTQQSTANGEISLLQKSISSLQGNLTAESTRMSNLTGVVDSLKAELGALTLAQGGVFQVNYVGNGEPGHLVAVPFRPSMVVIVDTNEGIIATVYHGLNDSSALFFKGLAMYEADYSSGTGSFYSHGMYNVSWIGSAPIGTMNVLGDHYVADFYP